MKKFLAILMGFIMSISMCFITSCSGLNKLFGKNKVELIGIQTSVFKEEVSTQSAKLTLYANNVEVEEPTDGDDIILPGTEEKTLLDGTDYTVIYKNQNIIKFTINLNNPDDYTIFDFRLTAENESVDYYDKAEDEWIPLSADESIRWQGINNKKCSYLLRLNNEEMTPSKLKISSMYYSSKTDGSNKNEVNLNNKETYTIYKIESSLENNIIKMTDIVNSESEFSFKINKIEGAEITGVVFDRNTITADENGVYKITKNGKLKIKYSYKVTENIIYKTTYEEDIELMKVEFLEDKQDIRIFSEDNIAIFVQISGSYIQELDKDTGLDVIKEYEGCRYYINSNTICLLNASLDDLEAYFLNTDIKVGGKIYKLSYFIKDTHQIIDLR